MRDLVVILAVVLLVFGTKKLRSIGSDLGAAVKGFKKAMAHGPDGPPGQVASDRPDAEFPEVAVRQRSERDGA